ncbi:exonuclease DPD1, chloroplastic/mitochondrial [Aegilops tauschii subsp. strangulata]|uniref:Exonuclease domain-containing protein n=2 Tax=Aegilops tauschii TaxID=37682 RepID=A0A453D0D0_AEGTS|nr:exonuclease DPD1, chloroplastic/mitochondrial [Aegilops tauschii subsp. strangulata]
MALLFRFSQLRNSIWSSCPARLRMQHTGLSPGTLLDPKSYEKRLFSTRVQETASLHRTDLGPCISGIQPLKFQQTSEHEQSAPLLIFDIETTGFFQKTTGNFQKGNRITEFAVRDLCGGKNSTFETLINPERDVPGYLKKVNNINTDLVCKPDVPRFSDVLPLLLAFVQSRQTPGKPVIWVAHKANTFDAPFLAQEFNRCSAQMPEDWLFVDSHCLARKLPMLEPSEDKKHLLNLESLSKRYGISAEGSAHRAMKDVTTLCHVFQKMSFDLKLTYEGLINEATKASYFSKLLK